VFRITYFLGQLSAVFRVLLLHSTKCDRDDKYLEKYWKAGGD
jgi:hypothetical protein